MQQGLLDFNDNPVAVFVKASGFRASIYMPTAILLSTPAAEHRRTLFHAI